MFNFYFPNINLAAVGRMDSGSRSGGREEGPT